MLGRSSWRMVVPAFLDPQIALVWKFAPVSEPRTALNASES